MANALWERRQDTEYYRMLAAGEHADRELADRERTGWASELRAQAEAAAAAGQRYFQLYRTCWVVFSLTDPDPLAARDSEAAGLVEHQRIHLLEGSWCHNNGCHNPDCTLLEHGEHYGYDTVAERRRFGVTMEHHAFATLDGAVASVLATL
jgi:hypothetical protein